MKDIFTTANMLFVLEGLKMTLYISFVSILLHPVWYNSGCTAQLTGDFRLLAAAYIEIVRNIPNLLWIYVILWFSD